MTHTTHYNFDKFEGDDPFLVSDFNETQTQVDDAMYSVLYGKMESKHDELESAKISKTDLTMDFASDVFNLNKSY